MSELQFYDLTYEGPVVQAILDTAQELRQNGYIFMGVGTTATDPGTPTERVWYLCGPGTYANFGSSVTVEDGSVMIASYSSGAWTQSVVEVGGGDSVAVTETFSLTGANLTAAQKILTIPAGALCTLSISPVDFNTSNIGSGYNIYSLSYRINGAATNVFTTMKGTDTVPATYTFTAVEADDYVVTLRANTGVVVNFTLNYFNPAFVTSQLTEASGKLVGSDGIYRALNQVVVESIRERGGIYKSSNTRRHIWFSVPKGTLHVTVSGTVSGYHYGLVQTNEISSVFTNGPVYAQSGWANNGYIDATFEQFCDYIAITVGKTNNGTITDAEISTVVSALTVKITRKRETKKAFLHTSKVLHGAHRGIFYTGMPENSLPSFRLAAKLGYDYIETDVRATSDGEFVIMHDASINRTCKTSSYETISGTVNVADTSLATLRSDYVLACEDPRYRTKIPTLDEYLSVVKDSKSIAMVELEPLTNAQIKAVYDRCLAVLGKGRFMFNSGHYEELDYVRSIDADVELLYATTPIIDTTSTVDGSSRNLPQNWQGANYEGNYGTINKSVVEANHAKGIRVCVWTVPADKYPDVMDWCPDMVMSNDIAANIPSLMATEFGGEYSTNGTIANKTISLTNGQYIDFASVCKGSGFVFVRINAKGSYTLTTNAKTLKSASTNTYAAFSMTRSSTEQAMTEVAQIYCDENLLGSTGSNMPVVRLSATAATEVYSVEIFDVPFDSI